MRTDAGVAIRDGTRADVKDCAAIYDAWIDATDWMPRVHPTDDVARHYRDTVFARQKVLVAQVNERVSGYLAHAGDGFVSALYVAISARRRGVGSALLGEAKRRWPEGLQLWTFVANAPARRFYQKHDFREVRRTEGDNEERLPDILLEWKRRDARTHGGTE